MPHYGLAIYLFTSGQCSTIHFGWVIFMLKQSKMQTKYKKNDSMYEITQTSCEALYFSFLNKEIYCQNSERFWTVIVLICVQIIFHLLWDKCLRMVIQQKAMIECQKAIRSSLAMNSLKLDHFFHYFYASLCSMFQS